MTMLSTHVVESVCPDQTTVYGSGTHVVLLKCPGQKRQRSVAMQSTQVVESTYRNQTTVYSHSTHVVLPSCPGKKKTKKLSVAIVHTLLCQAALIKQLLFHLLLCTVRQNLMSL